MTKRNLGGKGHFTLYFQERVHLEEKSGQVSGRLTTHTRSANFVIQCRPTCPGGVLPRKLGAPTVIKMVFHRQFLTEVSAFQVTPKLGHIDNEESAAQTPSNSAANLSPNGSV